MEIEDLILGHGERLGGEIWSNTCLAPGYLSDPELANLSCVALHRRHLQHLDMTRPSAIPAGTPETWPVVQIRRIETLFHELRVTRDPQTGDLNYPAGTLEYAARRTRVEGKGKNKKKTWIGSLAELRRAEEIVKAFNAADLMIAQEEMGVHNKELLVRLTYHDLGSALAMVRDGPYRYLLFGAGKARPDHEHLIMMLCAEGEKDLFYKQFVCQVP